jgi:tRNA threonylcarbamoyladenosine biosynthesis protein TsaE
VEGKIFLVRLKFKGGQLEIISEGPEETMAIGEHLVRLLPSGTIVGLAGELGSGKTCFVKGAARGLGIDPRKVTSPTFVLFNRYFGYKLLQHFDCYRLPRADEITELGLAEQSSREAITFIEWADKMNRGNQGISFLIEFELISEGSRRLRFRKVCGKYVDIIDELYKLLIIKS